MLYDPELVDNIKEAFQRYVASEGCSCCQDTEEHDKAKDDLGKLLGFPKYGDGSGYNFYAEEENA